MRAFTLIELLVVVAILGILLTIVVPSTRRARDLALGAVCRNRLSQLHAALHASRDEGGLALPAAADWVQHVSDRGAGGITLCPADSDPRPTGWVLGSIWLDHWPEGHGDLSNLAEIILNGKRHGDTGYHQVYVEVLDGGRIHEIRYVYPPKVGRDGAHSILQVVFDGNELELRSLNPEDYGYGIPGCMSSVTVWYGLPGEGGQELLQLTGKLPNGRFYQQVDPRSPVRLSSFFASYGFNRLVPRVPSRPDQVLLMDYYEAIADPDKQRPQWTVTEDGRQVYRYIAPRHLGRVNAVYVDGHVGSHWPEELRPDGEVWRP